MLAAHEQLMVAPVQVLMTLPQVFDGHTAVLTQQEPERAPLTTTPASTHWPPAHGQVRFEPSPRGKVGLAPFEHACPDAPFAPRLAQVS